MVGERGDLLRAINVWLDGKNYSHWSYLMRKFLKREKKGDVMLAVVV